MVLDVANASRGSARRTVGAVAGTLALGAALVLAGPADAYPLDSVSLETEGQSGVFVLEAQGGGQISHEVFCLDEPYRVVLDVFGADAPVRVENDRSGLVSSVRSSIWKDDDNGRIVRYVLETTVPVDYASANLDGKLTVTLTPIKQSTDPRPFPAGPETTSLASAGMGTQSPAPSAKGESQTDSEETAADIPAGTYPQLRADPTPVPTSGRAEETKQTLVAETLLPASATNALPAASATKVPGPNAAASHHDTAPVFGSADPRSVRTVSQPSSGSSAGGGAGRAMNLDVQNAEVRTVFRSIAEFSGVNIVPDRDVVGPVSIRLNEVPWRQALDIVAQSAGLIVVPNDDILRVATLRTYNAEELERESQARKKEDFLPLQTHVFRVGYANASELTGAIGLVLSDRGTVNFDSRTNALIVSDIAPRIEEASSLIRSLDTETQQVEIVARLVDMDRAATRRLGVTWNADNLGDADEGFSASGLVDAPLADASGQLRLGLIRSWGNLDATLEAFEQANEANIISNPRIMTVNNHPAEILVGREIPLITLDQAGNPVTELKKVGIALRCTPYINSDGRITMDLHPEISDLSSQATVQGGLIFTTTEAQTRIMVEDGQTAVIGGLIRTNETEFEQGVPILRDIPFLGHLFKSTDRVTEERELLIFVTPRIVTSVASNEP